VTHTLTSFLSSPACRFSFFFRIGHSSFTAAEIETIISSANGQDKILYALLAGSGLRIGEAFALQVEDVRDTVIQVKRSAWEGDLGSPKSAAGKREVDIHSSLASALGDHIGSRKDGLVFPDLRHQLFIEVSGTKPPKSMEAARCPSHLQEHWVKRSPQQIRFALQSTAR
jgi:integrase